MDKEPQAANAAALKTRINPVVVYCIIGAVIAFNIVLYLYVMDRLNQLDKDKAELLDSIKQYQEVPLPDLMKDPAFSSNERIEKLDRRQKELELTAPGQKHAGKETTGAISQPVEPDN